MMEILTYLTLHTINMWILKNLSLMENPTEVTLVLRGFGCMLSAFVLARKNNDSLLPKKIKLQLTRVLVAGLGLGLMITSYDYINASTVGVLFKFDVIFLIFLSLSSSSKLRGLSLYGLGAFALLVLHIVYFKEQGESLTGYGLALCGTFVISMGFILLSKSGKVENQAVTCFVPGFSIVLAGLVLGIIKQSDYSALSFVNMILAFVSGLVMFWIYIFTLKLYKNHSVVLTELLTFICILVFIPIEIWGLNISFDFEHTSSILVIGFYTLFIYLLKERRYS